MMLSFRYAIERFNEQLLVLLCERFQPTHSIKLMHAILVWMKLVSEGKKISISDLARKTYLPLSTISRFQQGFNDGVRTLLVPDPNDDRRMLVTMPQPRRSLRHLARVHELLEEMAGRPLNLTDLEVHTLLVDLFDCYLRRFAPNDHELKHLQTMWAWCRMVEEGKEVTARDLHEAVGLPIFTIRKWMRIYEEQGAVRLERSALDRRKHIMIPTEPIEFDEIENLLSRLIR